MPNDLTSYPPGSFKRTFVLNIPAIEEAYTSAMQAKKGTHAMTTECQYHNNCGGYCETPEQIAANLCEDCHEADQMDEAHAAALSDLRDALDFLDKARTDPAGIETGAVRDAREWLESAARKLVTSHV